MRLPARPIATSALCATLLLGITGSAAVAADSASAPEGTHAESRAPVPDADELLDQVKALSDLGGVLTPAADLLTAVLKEDDGQLPPSQAAKLGTGVKDAIAQATEAGPANVTTPDATQQKSPAADSPAPDSPVSNAGTLPAPAGDRAEVPERLAAEAMAALDKATDELLKAVTSDDSAEVTPAVNGVVARLVDVIAATMLGSELPAPTLAVPGVRPGTGD
ncbi:hypothetical protein ABT373_08720 [Streptomyces sp. NPDC000070]|uniref:hypothetical protein n=1 Tax=Streptomyces sp. NPDC000070 TaxID=3154240 RepID=UPI003329B7A8